MLFGFTGPSRAGKTTLARQVAEELGIHFHATSTTATAKAHGYDPVAPMTLRQRVDLQVILLQAHIKAIEELPRPLIVDRTPVDHLAYLLCEFHMQSHREVDELGIAAVERYKTTALNVVRQRYDTVFVLGQLPTYEQAADKPADNRAYHTHFQLLTEGIVTHLRGAANSAIIHETDLEVRAAYCHDFIVKRLDDIGKMRASAIHIN